MNLCFVIFNTLLNLFYTQDYLQKFQCLYDQFFISHVTQIKAQKFSNVQFNTLIAFIIGLSGVASACSEADDGSGNEADAANRSETDASEFPTACSVDVDCDDGLSCTTGFCKSDGTCQQIPRTGESCDDGDACTEGESCQTDGECSGGVAITHSEDPCQTCVCDPVAGLDCEVKAVGTSCDDGDCCSVGDSCLACDSESDPDCAEHGLKCVGNPKCGGDETETDEPVNLHSPSG